jgi:transcriptional regulator with XRE-family HTH domain
MEISMELLRLDLARAKGHWSKLSRNTGIEHSTIVRIARGATPNPQIETYRKIRVWLDTNLPLIEALSKSGEAPSRHHASLLALTP